MKGPLTRTQAAEINTTHRENATPSMMGPKWERSDAPSASKETENETLSEEGNRKQNTAERKVKVHMVLTVSLPFPRGSPLGNFLF